MVTGCFYVKERKKRMNTKNKRIWIFLFTIPCMLLFALVYAAPIITVFTPHCVNTRHLLNRRFRG